MSRFRKVVNNTIVSLLGQAVTWTSTLLLTIAYGRFLGDVKFGELFFAMSFVLLIGFPIDFGFNQQLTRDVAQEPEKALRYLPNTLLLKGALWLILYSFMLLTCWLLGYNAEERVLVTISGITLLSSSIASTFRALHYSFERVNLTVLGGVIEKGVTAIIGILLLEYGAGVQIMAIVLLSGSLLNSLWQALWFFRLVGLSFVIDRTLIRNLIHTSIPFTIYGALTVIYFRIDTVMLSLMTNAAVVGWYGAGYRLFDTLNFLPSLIIGPIMFPVFSKLSTTSEEDLRLAIEKSTNFLLFLGVPTTIGVIITAPNIIDFIYHRPEFVHTIPALQGLAPGLIFLYLNTVFSTIIVSTKREKKITIMAAIALVFNLGLNLIMIPLYQHTGAAIVTSLTELLLFCLSFIFIPKRLLPLRSLHVASKAIIASLVMALAVWALGVFHIFNIIIILPVAMLTYFTIAILIATIPREDIRAVYRAIFHKGQRTRTDSPAHQQIESQVTQKLPQVAAMHIPSPEETQEEELEMTVKLPRIKK